MNSQCHYQQDKSTLFPIGWKLVKLGSMTSKVGSGITPLGGSNTYLNQGIPFIRSQNVLIGLLDLSDVVYISKNQHQEMSKTYLQPNDVLLNITGASIGRCCVVPENFKEGNVNQHVCIIRPTENLNSNYLSMVLNSAIGQKQIQQFQAGGNRQGLNFQQIRSFTIPYPPLPEQRKIAEILSNWDEAIDKTERLIAALQTRKKGLMQRLLTGQVRFPGFDNKWEEVRIQEVIEINYGKSPKGIQEENGRYPIFGTGGIVGYTNKSLCSQNSIIIGRKGSIDQPQLTLTPYWAIDTTFYCTPKNGLDVRWLYYYLSHKGLARYNEGSTIPSLSRTTIQRLKLLLPTPSEQQKIADLLQECDTEINLQKQRVEKYIYQKKGLMQRLLTGQVRVKV